jgi:hypothetical protein
VTGPPTPESGFLTALADAVAERLTPMLQRAPVPVSSLTWRERLWVCPPETRLNVEEAAEGLGRPTSWIYRYTSTKALARAERAPLPHRRLDNELVFLAGELRDWIAAHEAIIQPGRSA